MDKVELIDWDKYIIYENGDVYSKHWNIYLSNKADKNGYITNRYMAKNGEYIRCRRNRVIYYYFNGEIPYGYEIDHIDTNKLNNSLNNLRCVTPKENTNNPLTIKHHSEAKKGKNHPFYGKHHTETSKKKISEKKSGTKLSDEHKRKITQSSHKKSVVQYDLDGNFIMWFESVMDAERQTKIRHIVECCNEKRKTAGGFIWKYA